MKDLQQVQEKLRQGGNSKYHQKNAETGKLFARERIALLCDAGSFVEDGLFANCVDPELPADGVVTGLGRIDGRAVALMANDSTVKAGSWGARTVEKILRIQETAAQLRVPLFYLVDSAGARITDQIEMFPGRRGAGKIFYNQVRLSGVVPQICLLFGPSAAGGAYIPAFCDVVFMVEGNASMYLGSPRMAEAVIGEKVTLEEMGGARMHCSVSGCGDLLAKDEKEAIAKARTYLSYLPQDETQSPPEAKAKASKRPSTDLAAILPASPARAYNMRDVLDAVIDEGSFFEIKELYAKEILTGFARLEGQPIGIVANQPLSKGGVLFVESSNKAARFIQICSAYGLPILFVADVPGFMIGSKTEKEGMIRAGAKMIYALSNARVPKISLVVRKAFGAGLYAMAGPAFGSDCVLALPPAQIAVMGPEPAVNAVYYNKIAELPEESRKAFVAEKIAEYEKDIDISRLASDLVIDAMVDFGQVRGELNRRFRFYQRSKEALRPPGIVPM
ncbi:acyl-CoA carboxylase subunit beta [bacterium]|nr:acyl-CoA carboxylase subunit beta [bacterium]